jgi:CPA2 family monovalent cation:H+ antiporter-2
VTVVQAGWHLLTDVLILLAAALVFGTIAERLRQSAIVGYLLAGAVVGPGLLGFVGTHGQAESTAGVNVIAELGVSLLLFTIGLEFSLTRLRKLGPLGLGGGTLQVVVTTVLVLPIAMLSGLGFPAAAAIALMVALSSTASVLRLLQDTATGETPHGRGATGFLLLQDVAVLPITLLVGALATGGGITQVALQLGKALLFAGGLVVIFFVLFSGIAPRLLKLKEWARNREFPILLAIVAALGSAWAAHEVGISPAIGAFLAGLLLAESPFAVQVRADVASLKTALVTLFFASIGMLADPAWALANWHLVVGATVAVLVGKSAVVFGVLSLPIRGIRQPAGVAAAAGLCLAQVGEFSFVLAKMGVQGGLLDADVFRLIVSVSILTLLVTPYLVKLAPAVAVRLNRTFPPRNTSASADPGTTDDPDTDPAGERVILVGFGPAGQQVAAELSQNLPGRGDVIDLNPRICGMAPDYGLAGHVGDARQADVLAHAGLARATVLIVTLPDPAAARQVIGVARANNPALTIVARSRYHVTRWELMLAGAEIVVDEEEHVGHRLAAEARRVLDNPAGDQHQSE